MIRVGVVGLGLGYALSKYAASKGYDVVGMDIDRNAFTHPRLDEETEKWLARRDPAVLFSNDVRDLRERELILIFVSTPLEGSRLSLRNIFAAISACRSVNENAEYAILSTLPIHAMEGLRGYFPMLRMSYTPPMVKKHKFLSTFFSPPSGWQMLSGTPSRMLQEMFAKLQADGTRQIIAPDEVVEAAKLLTNLMLASKIIMANAATGWLGPETGRRACEIVNLDPRVGYGYFTPGGKAAGPCFPRDLIELEAAATGDLKKIIQTLNEANGTETLL
jgi:UDP-glucose 6-dehydrogenase